MSLAIAIAAESVQKRIPGLQKLGGTLGASISGTFLLVIAVLDFIILLGILDVWKKTKSGEYDQQELDELMMQRGFINRIMGSRWRRFISDSWQMYPVGILFGLGFDTASEVGLLALTGAAATGHTGGGGAHHLPFMAIVALPLLFTAGMSAMDTTDGVVMAKAYGWAFKNPLRKVYYNMSTVTLGIFVAVGVGLVEYLQVFSSHAGLSGGFWDFLSGLDFEILGSLLVPVAPVLAAWAFGETGRQSSEGLGRLAAEHLDAIQGLVRLKAFNAADRWGRRLTGEEQDGQHCRPRHRVVGHPQGPQGNAEDGSSSHAQADKANVDAGQPTERRCVGGQLLAVVGEAPAPAARSVERLERDQALDRVEVLRCEPPEPLGELSARLAERPGRQDGGDRDQQRRHHHDAGGDGVKDRHPYQHADHADDRGEGEGDELAVVRAETLDAFHQHRLDPARAMADQVTRA